MRNEVDLNQAADEMTGYIRGKRDTKEEAQRLIKKHSQRIEGLPVCITDVNHIIDLLNVISEEIENI